MDAGRNLGKDAGNDLCTKGDADLEDGADEFTEEAAKVAEAGDNLELDVDGDDSKASGTGIEDTLGITECQQKALESDLQHSPASI